MQLWISVAVVVISLMFFLLKKRDVCKGRNARKVRPPIEDILNQNPKDIKYDLKDLKSPKLTGYPFHLLVRFAYTHLGSTSLIPSILHKSNLNLMGGEYIPETLTLYPSVQQRIMEDYSITKFYRLLLINMCLIPVVPSFITPLLTTIKLITLVNVHQVM